MNYVHKLWCTQSTFIKAKYHNIYVNQVLVKKKYINKENRKLYLVGVSLCWNLLQSEPILQIVHKSKQHDFLDNILWTLIANYVQRDIFMPQLAVGHAAIAK